MLYNEMLHMFTEISEVVVVRYVAYIGEVENARVLVRRLEGRRQFMLRQWKGVPWFVSRLHLNTFTAKLTIVDLIIHA
jgi:hypothetical protein